MITEAGGKRPEQILVVDDDPRIRQMLTRYFEEEGYKVLTAANGTAMREQFAVASIDLVLLDVVLPGGQDGYSLAREIRSRSDLPIIMLTGRDEVTDRVVGLEIGADDYIAKPFHLREVLARVRSVLRRRQPVVPESPAETGEVFHFDGWRLDMGRRELISDARGRVELTTGEFDMLAVLVRHPGRVMTREALMAQTRGRDLDVFDRTIDAQIARLRKKIEVSPAEPRLIKSVRGVGYVFAGGMES